MCRGSITQMELYYCEDRKASFYILEYEKKGGIFVNQGNRWSYIARPVFFGVKTIAYAGLALYLFSEIVGIESILNFFDAGDSSEEIIVIFNVEIPRRIAKWTLVTAILEVVDNLSSMFIKNTHVNNDKKDDSIDIRRLRIRVAKLEARITTKNSSRKS